MEVPAVQVAEISIGSLMTFKWLQMFFHTYNLHEQLILYTDVDSCHLGHPKKIKIKTGPFFVFIERFYSFFGLFSRFCPSEFPSPISSLDLSH